MAYRCVHCSAIYKDGSKEILTGCTNCSSKFFYYVKEEKLKEILEKKEQEPELTASEKHQIEEDVRDIAGITDEEVPVFLDFESVKIVKPGKYLLDLGKLFELGKPKVYQMEDGKYVVDLASPKMEDNEEE